MTMYIGFTSPNQNLFDKYARHGEGELAVADRANLTISARVYDGYISGGMHRLPPPYPEPVELRLADMQLGKIITIVARWSGDLAAWVITRGAFPDGNYEVNSNIEGTLGFTLQIRNSLAVIPPSKYLVQRPPFMPHMGGFPTNTKTNIIEFKGVRTSDTSSRVPFADAGPFTAPMTLANCWSESFGTNVPDYDGIAWPSTTPLGGTHYTAKQRYSYTDYASVAPDIDGWRGTPMVDALYDHSPSERLDGGPGTGGAGVVPSGFSASDGYYYILATTSIIRVAPKTREMTTVYGWVRKPGTPQPTAHALLPAGVERETWLKQFFDFVGIGPTISRAWQMCPTRNDDMIVGVADCSNHTIIEVDLRTGKGKVVAGSAGIRGFADGAVGVARFDQPRGITMVKTGLYAGNWVIADEHNSAYRLVDRLTGMTSTLTRAGRVPTRFPGDFSATDLTRKVNRFNWGAPTNADGTLNPFFKVQSFDNAQFCHPCHLALLSDGKTIVSVHHDEYRGFRLDLDAKTITHLFDFEGAATRADVSPKDWPTIHADTNGSMGYGIDALFVCSWHYNNMDVRSPVTGAQLIGNLVGPGTCGDHQGIRHNAYSRAMIILGDGSFIFNGDGQNSLQRVRRLLPTDPVIDKAKYARGSLLYRTDGPTRASVKTQNGTVGVNYLVNLKTPGELAMLTAGPRKAYMIANFGVTDWSDDDHLDVAYYLDANCPLGVQLMRAPPPAPAMMTFDAAEVVVRSGIPVRRTGAPVTITPADVKAVDWVKL